MSLLLAPEDYHESSRAAIPVSWATLTRGIGLIPTWHVRCPFSVGEDPWPSELVVTEQSRDEPSRWKLSADGHVVATGLSLSRTSAEALPPPARLDLVLIGIGSSAQDALSVPRQRVLRAAHLLSLLEQLGAEAFPGQPIDGTLESWSMPPKVCRDRFSASTGRGTPVIQDGRTDAEMILAALRQFRLSMLLGGRPTLREVHLTTCDARPGLLVCCGSSDYFSGEHAFDLTDVFERSAPMVYSGDGGGGNPFERENGRSSCLAVDVAWGESKADREAWAQWLRTPLPGLIKGLAGRLDGKVAHQAVETLECSSPELKVRRKTTIRHYPRGLEPPLHDPWLRWEGFGVCRKVRKGRVGVEIVNFGSGPAADASPGGASKTIEASLVTPYAGKTGTSGVHFEPERDTLVALNWSGRLGEPVLCMGNVRVQPVSMPSPSFSFEDGRPFRVVTSDAIELTASSSTFKLEG